MRYAIYFLPEFGSQLWAFGSAVLGYDAITGESVDHLSLDVDPPLDLAEATAEPRRYGFHATLKAPFRLAEGVCEDDLLAAATRFAATHQALPIGELDVRALGSFVALAPQPDEALQHFAARCVEQFDRFRAPMTPHERDKRLRAPLTCRQTELMEAWGYPYVLDEFRFHMTLTSSLPRGMIAPAQEALSVAYRPISTAVAISSICVCTQAPGRRFRLLRRLTLTQAEPQGSRGKTRAD